MIKHLLMLCLLFPHAVSAAENNATDEAPGTPPLLTTKQVEMLYYTQSGEAPSAALLDMTEEDFHTEYQSLQHTNDIAQFQRWATFSPIGYIDKQDCLPISTRAAISLGKRSSVTLKADNPGDFVCWILNHDENAALKYKNKKQRMMQVRSTLTIRGAAVEDGKRLLHVRVDKMEFYTLDKQTLLYTAYALAGGAE